MAWSDVGSKLSGVAPLLGSLLGGPVGMIAGAVGTMVASALGVKDDPAEVEKALTQSSLLKLKELENKERTRLIELQSQQISLELENVKSARRREEVLSTDGKFIGWLAPLIISIGVIITFIGSLYAMLVFGVGTELKEILLLVVGALAAQMNTVVSYYLGSSIGSSTKDKMIYNSIPS